MFGEWQLPLKVGALMGEEDCSVKWIGVNCWREAYLYVLLSCKGGVEDIERVMRTKTYLTLEQERKASDTLRSPSPTTIHILCRLLQFIEQEYSCTPYHHTMQVYSVYAHEFKYVKVERMGEDTYSLRRGEEGEAHIVVEKGCYFVLERRKNIILNSKSSINHKIFTHSNSKTPILFNTPKNSDQQRKRDTRISTYDSPFRNTMNHYQQPLIGRNSVYGSMECDRSTPNTHTLINNDQRNVLNIDTERSVQCHKLNMKDNFSHLHGITTNSINSINNNYFNNNVNTTHFNTSTNSKHSDPVTAPKEIAVKNNFSFMQQTGDGKGTSEVSRTLSNKKEIQEIKVKLEKMTVDLDSKIQEKELCKYKQHQDKPSKDNSIKLKRKFIQNSKINKQEKRTSKSPSFYLKKNEISNYLSSGGLKVVSNEERKCQINKMLMQEQARRTLRENDLKSMTMFKEASNVLEE